MVTSSIGLNQPIGASGTPRTFFFNGRLLAAEDLKREQLLRENGHSQLARLIGCGIAAGLEVSRFDDKQLSIGGGLGVTPSGQVIDVGDLTLDLAAAAVTGRPGGFANCAAAMANLEAPAAGIYLLALTATWIGSGRAATLLGEVGTCNRSVELPAVRARLLKVAAPVEASADTARNLTAHALLAPDAAHARLTHAAPLDSPKDSVRLVGWWPASVLATLTGDDLPIALLRIDSDAQLLWLDTAAARRRIAPPPGGAGDDFWRESHALEMEAFARQFVAQAGDEVMARKTAPDTAAAAFVKLPPVAVLDDTQLAALRTVFSKRAADQANRASLPVIPRQTDAVVSRAVFVATLHAALHDSTVSLADARASVLRLRGSDCYLLRLRHRDESDDSDEAGTVFEAGPNDFDRNERSSKDLASLAGRVLNEEKEHYSEEEKAMRSLAASVLTQAPDRPPAKAARKPRQARQTGAKP